MVCFDAPNPPHSFPSDLNVHGHDHCHINGSQPPSRTDLENNTIAAAPRHAHHRCSSIARWVTLRGPSLSPARPSLPPRFTRHVLYPPASLPTDSGLHSLRMPNAPSILAFGFFVCSSYWGSVHLCAGDFHIFIWGSFPAVLEHEVAFAISLGQTFKKYIGLKAQLFCSYVTLF